MRALVIGGAGFIGRAICKDLLNNGHEVVVADVEKVIKTFKLYEKDDQEQWDYEKIECDIIDTGRLNFVFKYEKPDVIFLVAAVSDVNIVKEKPLLAGQINVQGVQNVLECAKNAGIKNIVYSSTTWAYGNQNGVITEKSKVPAPNNLYTATKIMGEQYCMVYAEQFGMHCIILRYGIPYGEYARESTVIPAFVKKALNGEPLTIAGEGNQFRKFIDVRDLARAHTRCMELFSDLSTDSNILKWEIINVDGQEIITIRKLADEIQKNIPGTQIIYTPARPNDFLGADVNSDKACEILGWIPEINFETGLYEYILWVRKTWAKGN
jgi:UDP-glucose 4-epimerase